MRSRCATRVRVLVIALVAVFALPAAPVKAQGVVVEAAAFRVTIETTSDWTTARLTPGAVTASHVVSQTPSSSVEVVGPAIGLRPPSGGGYTIAVIDLVFAEVSGAPEVSLAVAKGWIGATRVRITRLAGSSAEVGTVLNNRQSSTDPSNLQRWNWRRAAFLGDTPLGLPRSDQRRLVLAFYYPWFDTYDDPRLTDRPQRPRSTYRRNDVLSMTRQARADGVDGFVVSWAGAAQDGFAFDLALDAAERTDGTVTGYLEVAAAVGAAGGNSTTAVATVRRWLNELLVRSSRNGFLRSGDEPVIFAFATAALPAASWRVLLDEQAAAGRPIRVVGDTTDPAYAGVLWGEHDYSALGTAAERERAARDRTLRLRSAPQVVPGAAGRLSAATVAPGYDDHLVRDGNPVVPRGPEGERYAETWAAATAGDPDWVLVTSWNEWFEGTSIEPSVLSGDRALRQTRELAAAWRR